jgi:hypothetical protein
MLRLGAKRRSGEELASDLMRRCYVIAAADGDPTFGLYATCCLGDRGTGGAEMANSSSAHQHS